MPQEAYELLHKILSYRAEYWRERDNDMGAVYGTVLGMLEYAHINNIECLRQYDYYYG